MCATADPGGAYGIVFECLERLDVRERLAVKDVDAYLLSAPPNTRSEPGTSRGPPPPGPSSC